MRQPKHPPKQQKKSSQGKSVSSKDWLRRQARDPFVAKAQKDGYRSRAAYKLLQIDEKFHLFRPGMVVVDLGAAPGSWLQVVRQKLGHKTQPTIIGVDLLPIAPIPDVVCIEGDFTEPLIQDQLKTLLNRPIDLVLSDMAPSTSGHASLDHLRIVELAETALDFALTHLRPGGTFVTKLFQGAEERKFFALVTQHFTTVKRFKPTASRQESVEFFIVATGFNHS